MRRKMSRDEGEVGVVGARPGRTSTAKPVLERRWMSWLKEASASASCWEGGEGGGRE